MVGKTRPCEICKELIDPERVAAVPETRLCTEHARQIQKYGGEFLVTSSQERTSKPGSLKRNYGGVDIKKVRNSLAIEKLRAPRSGADGGSRAGVSSIGPTPAHESSARMKSDRLETPVRRSSRRVVQAKL